MARRSAKRAQTSRYLSEFDVSPDVRVNGQGPSGDCRAIAQVFRTMRSQRFYLLALLPFLAYAIIFFYYPMYGVLLAFKDFSYARGILLSPWAGLKYFEMFFTSPDVGLVLRNTLAMSLLSIGIGFPVPIAFAILISEMRRLGYKKLVQTISYLPHFIAWIVVAGLVIQLLSREGTVNDVLLSVGVVDEPVNFLSRGDPSFWFLIAGLNLWKNVGWNSIIYIAAIATINPELYQAAIIDGASILQRIWYVTIPQIAPTAVLLFILSLGYLLNAGFEQQLFLMNPLNHEYAEVIDTFVFKYGLQKFMFSYGAAVGLMKSVVALVLVVGSNAVMKRLTEHGLF